MDYFINTLIVDDETELRESVKSILETSGELDFNFFEANDGLTAIEQIQKNSTINLVIMDVRMPKMTGLEALKKIKELRPDVLVIIVTAHSNLQDAISAIKNGAYDYLEKPLQPSKLNELVKKSIEAQGLFSNLLINNPIFDDDVESPFVKSSKKMKGVYELIHRLGNVDTTVLIRGENGTGKELVAMAVHQNSSKKHGEFVAINCAAIPENLLKSELFGHEKGAFTGADKRKIGLFQHANNGTIFLDEIGDLKPEMQSKILRVLQEGKFIPVGSLREVQTNARVIAATNRNLEKMIDLGTFREDLFYRLNVMPIFLPPLKERLDDIKELSLFFMKKYSQLQNKKISSIHEDVLTCFQAYDWPGNIRELENVIQHAFVLENTKTIQMSSLPDNIKNKKKSDLPLDFDKFKENSEKNFIINAPKANKGKINKTVANANIPKNTLLRKIKKYQIDVKTFS